ncbi:MAG: hypothetical protein ACLRNQ_23040 [Flavonifractor plautii]
MLFPFAARCRKITAIEILCGRNHTNEPYHAKSRCPGAGLRPDAPLAACGGDKTNQPSPDTTPVAAATPEPTPTPATDPYDAVRTYWSADQLTQAWGPDQAVEHLFFHPVIAYPEYAFSDAVPYDRQVGLDEWMVTADEYKKILQSVYDKGYILVNMGDVWSEVTGEDGVTRMERNTLMLPEGKSPSSSLLMM